MAKIINITEKTTKQGFVKFLKEYLDSPIVDKNLSDRIKYALDMFSKDQTKVAKSDLFDLAKEVMQSMTPATPAPVEASLKPKKSGAKKPAKVEEPAEEVEETTEEETAVTEEAPAEPEKKPGKKKSSLKKSGKDSKKAEVETLPAASNVGIDHLPSAKMFPAEIDHPELGKLIACTGAYTTYAEVLKALEEEKTLYFAVYWTKRHIREYGYSEAFLVNVPKEGFPLNLDILMAVLPCETMERVFAMSRITEALYRFEGAEFKPIEDIDPRSGEKFQIRVTGGAEFEIYRPAEEEIATID